MRTIRWLLVLVLGVCCCRVASATTAAVCDDPALAIPDGGAPDEFAVATLFVDTNVAIEEVSVVVHVSHTFIGDLAIVVGSPSGTFVELYDGAGDDEDDINVNFSDSGYDYDSVSWVCECPVKPSGPGTLADFDAEESAGTWGIAIGDFVPEDAGTLDRWCLTVSGCAIFSPVDVICSVDESTVTVSWPEIEPVPSVINIYQDGELYTKLGSYTTTYEFDGVSAGLFIYEIEAVDAGYGCSSIVGRCEAGIGASNFCTTGPAGNHISYELLPVVSELEIAVDFAPVEIAVGVDITHTFIGDLAIVVESPDAVSVTLFDAVYGSPFTGDDDMNLVYADHGAPQGSVPLTCGCYVQPLVDGTMSDLVGESTAGIWTLTVTDQALDENGVLNSWCVQTYAEVNNGPLFLRGDVDGNGHFAGLADSLFLLRYAFTSGTAPPCLEAADADGNGSVNGLLDGLRILNHAFLQGAAPPEPYPDCGTPASISISCDVEPDCS